MTRAQSPLSRRDVHASFELLEHTADIGIAARGENLADLFRAAAEGLRFIVTSAPCCAEQKRHLFLQGHDVEELLVTWLQEILYLLESEQFLPAAFDIESITPTSIEASLTGTRLDPAHQQLEREIKAVTFHRLAIHQHEHGWRATVYLDI